MRQTRGENERVMENGSALARHNRLHVVSLTRLISVFTGAGARPIPRQHPYGEEPGRRSSPSQRTRFVYTSYEETIHT